MGTLTAADIPAVSQQEYVGNLCIRLNDRLKVVNWVVTNDTGGRLFLSRKGREVKRGWGLGCFVPGTGRDVLV